MSLNENIFKLRKKSKISQEKLAEKVGVTRQTISNWELGETSPNPEQLKLLSKELNISVDDLLENNLNNVIVDKVNNTEKNTKYISKVVKYIVIVLLILLIIDFITFIYCYTNKKGPFENNEDVSISCTINNKGGEKYI